MSHCLIRAVAEGIGTVRYNFDYFKELSGTCYDLRQITVICSIRFNEIILSLGEGIVMRVNIALPNVRK